MKMYYFITSIHVNNCRPVDVGRVHQVAELTVPSQKCYTQVMN